LFGEIAGISIATALNQIPVALSFDPTRGYRVLTAKHLTTPGYIMALNMALIALFCTEGFTLAQPAIA
jgi:hypothetical protein